MVGVDVGGTGGVLPDIFGRNGRQVVDGLPETDSETASG